jgi:hypothetical protein
MSHAFGGRALVRFGTSLTITCDLEVPVALLQVTGSRFAVRGSRFTKPQSPQISYSANLWAHNIAWLSGLLTYYRRPFLEMPIQSDQTSHLSCNHSLLRWEKPTLTSYTHMHMYGKCKVSQKKSETSELCCAVHYSTLVIKTELIRCSKVETWIAAPSKD